MVSQTNTITLSSPAKINLFLRVLRKRPDGYHDIASLFQAISLSDTLHFSLADEDRLTCTDPTIPTDSSNLVLKAANLFRKKTGLQFGLHVHLEKKIPQQAGLGGGSSNAATTLWALNSLFGNKFSTEQLSTWSSEIGSDIPFFFSSGTAFCTGRGDKVLNLNPLPLQSLFIIKPEIGLSTPMVYAQVKPIELPQRDPDHDVRSFLAGKMVYYNDLEPAAFSLKPKLSTLKNTLQKCGFHTVQMSGSGTAFFCLGKSKELTGLKLLKFDATFVHRAHNEWFKNY